MLPIFSTWVRKPKKKKRIHPHPLAARDTLFITAYSHRNRNRRLKKIVRRVAYADGMLRRRGDLASWGGRVVVGQVETIQTGTQQISEQQSHAQAPGSVTESWQTQQTLAANNNSVRQHPVEGSHGPGYVPGSPAHRPVPSAGQRRWVGCTGPGPRPGIDSDRAPHSLRAMSSGCEVRCGPRARGNRPATVRRGIWTLASPLPWLLA